MKIRDTNNKIITKHLLWSALLHLFLNYPLLSIAQQLTLERKLIPKEITKLSTYDILEDKHGFIWFGGGGLYRHDGYKAVKYLPTVGGANSLGIVIELMEDSYGYIWMGTSKGLFRYDQHTAELRPFVHEKLTDQFGNTPQIVSLLLDSKGRIWVGIEDNLFVMNGPEGEEIRTVEQLELGYFGWIYEGIRDLAEGHSGRIFGGSIEGLWEIDEDLKAKLHKPKKYTESKAEFRVTKLARGRGDTMWIASPEGLWAFESERKKFTEVVIPGYSRRWVEELFMDGRGELWVSTKDGIYRRHVNGNFQKLKGDANLLYADINALHFDKQGNLWFGNMQGAGMLDFTPNERLPFYQIGMGAPFHDNNFYRIHQDASGAIWARMGHTGLGYCRELGGPFEILLQPSEHYFSEEIKDMCGDVDGNVWVITNTNGLFLFEKGKKEFRQLMLTDSLRRIAMPADIIPDNKNDRLLWISTRNGLMRLDRITLQRKWFFPKDDLPWLQLNAIGHIGQSDEGDIWCKLFMGSQDILGYFDPKKEKFVAEQDHPGRPEARNLHMYQQVAPGEMWIATNRGFIIADTKKKTQRFWTKEDGLPISNILGFVPDREGNIWMVGRNKIYRYDGQSFTMYNPNEAIEHFENTTALLVNDSLIAFGGANGLHVFDPKKMVADSVIPKVFLTDFQVFNEKKDFDQAIELVQQITLPYSDKVFSFEFAGLDYAHAHRVRYRHILEGFEDDWVETGSDERRATYTNLAPGKYTFKVKAANVDGFWTPDSEMLCIGLTILSPWYRTWWAYLLWAALFFGSIYWFYQFQLNRQFAESEAQRLKELDTIKSHLYTNITHEFRTPLTVILGMASLPPAPSKGGGDMTSAVPSPPPLEGAGGRLESDQRMHLIRRNGQQLLHLVNQLLDLSKLESGNMPLHYVHGDVVAFIKYLVESFHSFADSKDIRLHFLCELNELPMDYDPEKLQNIISNLLSNAIKFTPAGGDIYLKLEIKSQESGGRELNRPQELLLLEIKDTGIGIKERDLPHIFDRFYQADDSSTRKGDGTGIGLSLCKELIKLMGGEISAKSGAGTGSQFTILLPISDENKSKQQVEIRQPNTALAAAILPDEVHAPPIGELMPINKQPLVLLIEDNADVITYLTSLLSSHYEILTATDGQSGIEQAIEHIPDLIVSDVMMPKKDGFEVCETLKSDERTSHIPIILLTAKADQSAKIEGLTHGADAYLAKPFHKEELLVRIEKLIEGRRQLQQRFAGQGAFLEITKTKAPTSDELFLQKLIGIVEAHLSDENFGMPELCKQAAMSRTQLFRKLKALTGKSGTRFIRSIRLEKAKELLETTELAISEVAFQTGFGSAAYFSRVFQEEFGVPPSEVRNN